MIKKFITFLVLFLTIFSYTNIVKAGINDAFQIGGEIEARTGNISERPLSTAAGEMGYDVSQNDINSIIEVIIRIALSLLGVIFIVILIYGGYLWMTSRGNEQQYEKSKNLIRAAIIGLCIVASAYAITWYITSTLGQSTLNN
jgi:hypothetical protein